MRYHHQLYHCRENALKISLRFFFPVESANVLLYGYLENLLCLLIGLMVVVYIDFSRILDKDWQCKG